MWHPTLTTSMQTKAVLTLKYTHNSKKESNSHSRIAQRKGRATLSSSIESNLKVGSNLLPANVTLSWSEIHALLKKKEIESKRGRALWQALKFFFGVLTRDRALVELTPGTRAPRGEERETRWWMDRVHQVSSSAHNWALFIFKDYIFFDVPWRHCKTYLCPLTGVHLRQLPARYWEKKKEIFVNIRRRSGSFSSFFFTQRLSGGMKRTKWRLIFLRTWRRKPGKEGNRIR